MAEITAGLVKELRERTGAGMMDCKRALSEAVGDLEVATDWLRKKGLAAAAKKASRVTSEGLIGMALTGTAGALVEVNAETDFVARNETFQELARRIAALAPSARGDLEALRAARIAETGRTVADEITQAIAVIGENINLRRTAYLEVPQGAVAGYLHNQLVPGLGKLGVLVALESQGDAAAVAETGKQLAMHVAATNPQAVSTDRLDPAVIERERAIYADQARTSGKPENIIEKMVEGRLRKFYEEAVLLEQIYVIDTDKRVKEAVQAAAEELGHPVQVVAFVRMALGEGVDRGGDDFAAEVAQLAGGLTDASGDDRHEPTSERSPAMTESDQPGPRYRRVLLKMSGEALLGDAEFGHDRRVLRQLADDCAAVHALGVELCLVIGGGNIIRGGTLAAAGVERTTADYMGMLGTVINALAVQSVIEHQTGIPTRVMSAIPMSAVCEPYIRRRAMRHLEKARIVIFAAGTGNPYFTTDTAAALRAAELECDAILKGTQVDGVYSADPRLDPNARRFDRLSYLDVLSRDLKVMDASAISLARESSIPIIVFSVHAPGSFARVLRGEGPHTIITEEAAA